MVEPSGDRASLRASELEAPGELHALPAVSHFQRLPAVLNWMNFASSESSICWKGSFPASYWPPEAVESAAATLAWSNAGALVTFAASMRMNWVPSAVVVRYQKRSPEIQVGRTPPCKTSGLVL